MAQFVGNETTYKYIFAFSYFCNLILIYFHPPFPVHCVSHSVKLFRTKVFPVFGRVLCRRWCVTFRVCSCPAPQSIWSTSTLFETKKIVNQWAVSFSLSAPVWCIHCKWSPHAWPFPVHVWRRPIHRTCKSTTVGRCVGVNCTQRANINVAVHCFGDAMLCQLLLPWKQCHFRLFQRWANKLLW